MMKLKIDFSNKEVFSTKDIILPSVTIPARTVFQIIDAYKENDSVVIGIQTSNGIEEAIYKTPVSRKIEKIKTTEQLNRFIESFIYPYHKNVKYTIYTPTKND